jgi:hypothetical protein
VGSLHSSASATGAGISTFECATFVLGSSAKHSGVLAGLDGQFQAGLNNLAAIADGFGFVYLEKRGAGVSDGEEKLGVLV